MTEALFPGAGEQFAQIKTSVKEGPEQQQVVDHLLERLIHLSQERTLPEPIRLSEQYAHLEPQVRHTKDRFARTDEQTLVVHGVASHCAKMIARSRGAKCLTSGFKPMLHLPTMGDSNGQVDEKLKELLRHEQLRLGAQIVPLLPADLPRRIGKDIDASTLPDVWQATHGRLNLPHLLNIAMEKSPEDPDYAASWQAYFALQEAVERIVDVRVISTVNAVGKTANQLDQLSGISGVYTDSQVSPILAVAQRVIPWGQDEKNTPFTVFPPVLLIPSIHIKGQFGAQGFPKGFTSQFTK
ncbi:MAG: hypothetical protein Q8P72_03435 [Candidatus Roizmanbacteria bacterium]|nr:hypothetical protein [Candidatus Roizmanbacteria bacterium]